MKCLAWILVLAAGCAQAPPDPVQLRVGDQRMSVVIPDGWEHLDYGDHHQLRKGLARIAVKEIQGSPETGPRRLGENEQREIASRTPFEAGSHRGMIIDTWDRLSHDHRKRFVFLQGRGPLLAIYMMSGLLEEVGPDLEALVASVALVDTLGLGEVESQ